MPITIRRVTESHELLAVYRQRYEVYVEELKYPQAHADHEAKTIREPPDDSGHILAAFDENGYLIGSVRNNYGCEGDLGEYVEWYQMRQFGDYFPRHLGISTKLLVAPGHRVGTFMMRLCAASFAYSLQQFGSVSWIGLIDSKPPLDYYFRRLGYRQIAPPFCHTAAGEVIPLVIPVHDREYLVRIKSPFAKALPEGPEHESVRWFRETFAEELAQYKTADSDASPRVQHRHFFSMTPRTFSHAVRRSLHPSVYLLPPVHFGSVPSPTPCLPFS